MLPKIFTFINITEMHFNGRETATGKGTTNRNAGVRISGRIDQNTCKFLSCTPNFVDECPLVIALKGLDLNPQGGCFFFKRLVDLIKGMKSYSSFSPTLLFT